MNVRVLDKMMPILRKEYARFPMPIVTQYSHVRRDPFKILISTLISLRTKDAVTAEASKKLFHLADTPERMRRLSLPAIEKAIYPAGFYHNKARTIVYVCSELMERFGGKVPDDLDQLLTMKGVGRKTANLVVTLGFDKPGICVDTHVHRISNRFGLVRTKTPDETEMALRKKLPPKYWIEYNDLLVTYGQNVCKPISPLCSQCKVEKLCEKVGVGKRR